MDSSVCCFSGSNFDQAMVFNLKFNLKFKV